MKGTTAGILLAELHRQSASAGIGITLDVLARARLAAVPVAVRGCRGRLRADPWFSRRSPLEVLIGTPSLPHCGEPAVDVGA